MVASCVEKDFNDAWFYNEEGIRSDSEKVQADYQKFHDKGKYLAAKLMTIFMEYPIIFMGYSLPSDDISYRSMLSSRCQQKNKKGDKLRVTVVLYDSESERKWYEGDDLQSYLVERSNTEAAQSIVRIKEVLGEDTPIRAYLQGIPDVFLDCNENVSKENVLNLINWN